jgi:dihydrofolate reductase
MSARRKIIVYIATSADGYIARPDGDVEWLNRRPDTIDHGMKGFLPDDRCDPVGT